MPCSASLSTTCWTRSAATTCSFGSCIRRDYDVRGDMRCRPTRLPTTDIARQSSTIDAENAERFTTCSPEAYGARAVCPVPIRRELVQVGVQLLSALHPVPLPWIAVLHTYGPAGGLSLCNYRTRGHRPGHMCASSRLWQVRITCGVWRGCHPVGRPLAAHRSSSFSEESPTGFPRRI